MTIQVPKTVFLAGSTVELISALACLTGLGITDAAVFVERNISFKTAAMDPLLAAARKRFSSVMFIELEIERTSLSGITKERWWHNVAARWKHAISIRKHLEAACQAHYKMPLRVFGAQLENVFFTTLLHDYVVVFLAACRDANCVFFPHGFDHPRREHVTDHSYSVLPRGVRTTWKTLSKQRKHFGLGGLSIGTVGRLVGKPTVRLPFSGVDRVVTFRSGITYIPNELVEVKALQEIFQWLLLQQPWREILQSRHGTKGLESAVLLLLPEFNVNPLWEANPNFGVSLLQLLRQMEKKTGLKRFVFKAHVRSDGTAAKWLASFIRREEMDWEVEVFPMALSGLPVEALVLSGEFLAACSLGSGSLPPGLGFGIPHYVSLMASRLFDEGWRQSTLVNTARNCQLLIDEGICRELENGLEAGGMPIHPGCF